MKNIEKTLPFAIDAIKKFICIDDGKTVPKEFKGYIASFGASIIQSGLKPSLAFYSQAKESKGDRSFLIPSLIYILLKEGIFPNKNKEILEKLNSIVIDYKNLKSNMYFFVDTLFGFIEDNNEFAKRKILNAATSLKLALRLFKTSENNDGES